MVQTEVSKLNQRELRKLILSIKASTGQLSLLLAICDDRNLQAELIDAYETALQQRGITPYQTRLDWKQPSLRATLTHLIDSQPALQDEAPAVITVLGATDLIGVRLTEEKSEQERFFFSLQWTRESLRAFHFPIVIWLSDTVATRLVQQAPDFWSWRSGVFEFEREAKGQVLKAEAAVGKGSALRGSLSYGDNEDSRPLSVDEIQQQIDELEKQDSQSSLLVTLYSDLGKAHERQYNHEAALGTYEQALYLAEIHKDRAMQAVLLQNLGNVLDDCGRYLQAINFYEQSLAIWVEISDRHGEARALNSLGNACCLLSQYERAIALHEQSLVITRELGDRKGEAKSLNSLGIAYSLLSQYERTISLHEQSLAIARDLGDRHGEAHALNNLGIAYFSLSQYERAIALHEQSLAIVRDLGNRHGEAHALNNLGNAYYSLSQYEQALSFYKQSLAIEREISDRNGEADSLYNMARALIRLNRRFEAKQRFEQALIIYEDLKLAHKIEQCKDAIATCNQIIPT
ncbi:MAG: tetratricopeptide repeat protein [Cyanobacteria bacterium P01_D01_bin.44]